MTTVLTRARLAGRRNLVCTAAAVAFVLVLGPAPRVVGQEPAVRMIADEGEAASYWPRWRGPSGQGLVTGSGYRGHLVRH